MDSGTLSFCYLGYNIFKETKGKMRTNQINANIRWHLFKKAILENFAKVTNRRFSCRALEGDSFYNIAINSDFSISCNCNDIYGFGKLGSLEKQDFSKIFFGKKANYFRNSLSKRKTADYKLPFLPGLVICKGRRQKNTLKIPPSQRPL